MTQESILVLVAGALLAALAIGYAVGWRRRDREVGALRAEAARAQTELEAKRRALAAAAQDCERIAAELAALREGEGRSHAQIEQLRDLVKVHVARRREFDLWAEPIRTSLGDAVGEVMRKLKDQLARQEFAMKRQERIVAEAQDQYRGKRDELEHMRRELTLKNYHIAALNERFIRIEERMQDLAAQVAGMGGGPPPQAGATADAPERAPHPRDAAGSSTAAAQFSPETERFNVDGQDARDWMSVLDDWHRQLHQRFDRLETLQARLRGQAGRMQDAPRAQSGRSDGGGAA